jgi:hypothetical protein
MMSPATRWSSIVPAESSKSSIRQPARSVLPRSMFVTVLGGSNYQRGGVLDEVCPSLVTKLMGCGISRTPTEVRSLPADLAPSLGGSERLLFA